MTRSAHRGHVRRGGRPLVGSYAEDAVHAVLPLGACPPATCGGSRSSKTLPATRSVEDRTSAEDSRRKRRFHRPPVAAVLVPDPRRRTAAIVDPSPFAVSCWPMIVDEHAP